MQDIMSHLKHINILLIQENIVRLKEIMSINIIMF